VQRTNVNRTTVEKMAAEGLLEGMPASDQIDMFEVIAEPEGQNVAQASRLEKPGNQKPENLQKELQEPEDQGFLF